ncbi:MAG: hypothetical protein HZB18_15775 [Chloroflexi bacterium]|nr:hypothetical protein [Chloroflexota bacterium]
MNSALRGGRAAKNAIDAGNNTLNIPRVKVLSHAKCTFFVDDLLLNFPLQYIK